MLNKIGEKNLKKRSILSREIPEIWEWVTVFTVHERSFRLENGRFVTLGRARG